MANDEWEEEFFLTAPEECINQPLNYPTNGIKIPCYEHTLNNEPCSHQVCNLGIIWNKEHSTKIPLRTMPLSEIKKIRCGIHYKVYCRRKRWSNAVNSTINKICDNNRITIRERRHLDFHDVLMLSGFTDPDYMLHHYKSIVEIEMRYRMSQSRINKLIHSRYWGRDMRSPYFNNTNSSKTQINKSASQHNPVVYAISESEFEPETELEDEEMEYRATDNSNDHLYRNIPNVINHNVNTDNNISDEETCDKHTIGKRKRYDDSITSSLIQRLAKRIRLR